MENIPYSVGELIPDCKLFLHVLLRNRFRMEAPTLHKMKQFPARGGAARDWLARNLRRLVDRRGGPTRTELARAAGIDAKTVWNIIEGRTYARIDRVEKVASALGLEVYELLLPPHDAGLADLIAVYRRLSPEGRRWLEQASESARELDKQRRPPRGDQELR